jgi:hypothetical protein
MKIKILVIALIMSAVTCPATDASSISMDKIPSTHLLKSAHKQSPHAKKKVVLRKSELVDISDFDDVIIDDDTVLGRNRRVQDYGKLISEPAVDISDYVKIRLMVARMKALKRYQEIRNVV